MQLAEAAQRLGRPGIERQCLGIGDARGFVVAGGLGNLRHPDRRLGRERIGLSGGPGCRFGGARIAPRQRDLGAQQQGLGQKVAVLGHQRDLRFCCLDVPGGEAGTRQAKSGLR
ncbi:hypothetical protein D3C87_1476710 [compost metagenome]